MKIALTFGLLLSLSMSGVAFAGGNKTSNCGCTHDKLSPPIVDTVSAAQAVAGSESISGAVGIGGEGGAARSSSVTTASTGNMSSNIKTGSSSSISSGNGAIVSYNSPYPVQVPELPPTIVNGSITLVKSGTCGPLIKVKPFSREMYVPEVFGLYEKRVPVRSLQGKMEGPAKRSFIYSKVTLPQEYGGEKILTVWGDQLYITVGNDGQGGSAGGAANYAARTAVGLGTGLAANSNYGIVAEAAVMCVFSEEKAYPRPLAVGLNTPKVDVLAAGGKYRLFKKPRGPILCGGKPVPQGYYCGFVRNHVNVVKNVTVITTSRK